MWITQTHNEIFFEKTIYIIGNASFLRKYETSVEGFQYAYC